MLQDTGLGINQHTCTNYLLSMNETTPGANNERGTCPGLRLCKQLIDKSSVKCRWKTKSELADCFALSRQHHFQTALL